MSLSVDRLADLVGAGAVGRSPDGTPRVQPGSVEAAATVLREATGRGLRVRIEGSGSWVPPDAPADLAVHTGAFDRVEQVAPDDLVATVGAGITMRALHADLRRHGAWLAVDPPGAPERTLGSVLATGTAGPLRGGFGGVRDHVLGLTLITGDGRVVEPGGRVVKNVAGYDLTRLQVGAFGAFGLVARVHLRLRAAPRADRTWSVTGARDELIAIARGMASAGIAPAAGELLSPGWAGGDAWHLAVRLMGTADAVEAEGARLRALAGPGWQPLEPDAAAAFWEAVAQRATSDPVTLRLGVLTPGLGDALDLVARTFDGGSVSVGVTHGAVRWSGACSAASLAALRTRASEREWPVTLERAPWSIRGGGGHFGACREGVGPLVERIRQQFDPAATLVVPLVGIPDA